MEASEGFGKKFRLLSHRDFQNLHNGSVFIKSGKVHAYFKRTSNDQDFCRLGLSIGKKIGNAVKRNLLKRIIREDFRKGPLKLLSMDLLVIVSKDINSLTHNDAKNRVREDFRTLTKKLMKSL